MVTTAGLGASGFSGQETLDRVLAHPELELVALGSDSLAGQPAAALDPRLGRHGLRAGRARPRLAGGTARRGARSAARPQRLRLAAGVRAERRGAREWRGRP